MGFDRATERGSAYNTAACISTLQQTSILDTDPPLYSTKYYPANVETWEGSENVLVDGTGQIR